MRHNDSCVEWVPIPGHENYEASSGGDIRRVGSSGTLACAVGSCGYRYVGLCNNGETVTNKVSILVATAFFGAIPDGYDVHHCDLDRTNDSVCNLQVVSNSIHRSIHNRCRGLTATQVNSVFIMHYCGVTGRDIAAIMDMTPGGISDVLHGRSKSHVKLLYGMKRVPSRPKKHLSDEQKTKAVELVKSGMTRRAAADVLGVTPEMVTRHIASSHPEMVSHRRHSNDIHDNALALYDAGSSTEEIAEATSMSISAVRALLRKSREDFGRGPNMTKEETQEALRMMESGMTQSAVAKQFGRDQTAMSSIWRKAKANA